MLEMETKAAVGTGKLKSFWKKSLSPPAAKKKRIESSAEKPSTSTVSADVEKIVIEDDEKLKDTPAQTKSRKVIVDLKDQLSSLIILQDSGMSIVNKKEIDDVKAKLSKEQTHLQRLIRESLRQRNRRLKLKEGIDKVCADNSEAASVLKSFNRNKPGRPRIESDQPKLIATIINLVQSSTAAHDHRHIEHLHNVTTLDELHSELTKLGFQLSRTALYLRLLPRRGDTIEGKRHVTTVPVKLLRPENCLRKKNMDRMFAKSFIDDMFEVCKLFGPRAVLFMSNDHKARILLGLAEANLQAPLLMQMDYQAKLLDHDFPQHKLIPSVYAMCEVTKFGTLSYTGDTFIRVRSGKHDTSNEYTHAHDVRELFQCNFVERKPIILMETDGAQDEVQRFPQTLATAVDLFRLLNLDVLLRGLNSAGLSSFNPVERRMATLSHDLAGLVLPHDSFGDHLDSNGKTIDYELEKNNFQKAADVLSEVWSETVIDGHPVDCIAIPIGEKYIPPTPDPLWVSNHCRQSRYFLQIVKCRDVTCCSPFKTNWLKVFQNRFIPCPAIYKYDHSGMVAVELSSYFDNNQRAEFAPLYQRLLWKSDPTESAGYPVVPSDIYCPSTREKLDKEMCNTCNQYRPGEAVTKSHTKAQKQKIKEQETNDEEEDEKNAGNLAVTEGDTNIPIFTNICDIFRSPFVEES